MQADFGRVVITGAGGGIGLGLVREFASRGFRVLALIRNIGKRAELDRAIEGLEDLVEVEELDVTRAGGFHMPEDVGILINNAGIRYEYLPVEEIGIAEWREYFDVNFFGVVELTQKAIPLMRKARRGIICNINSSSLFYPMPFLGPYRATKGALAAYSETLRAELAPHGVRVVEIFPGPVTTGITSGGILQKKAAAASYAPYADMAERQRANQVAANLPQLSAEEAAKGIVDNILDSDGPMRHGTCAASEGGLEMWRPGHGGEPLLQQAIGSLLGTGGATA
jgi:NAD(P)-dependent dehydrogenase (short-subunit alcohol dehydrogenase family)